MRLNELCDNGADIKGLDREDVLRLKNERVHKFMVKYPDFADGILMPCYSVCKETNDNASKKKQKTPKPRSGRK